MMHIARVVTSCFVAPGKRAKDGGPTIGAGPIATQPRNAGWRRCIIDAPIVGAVGGGIPHRPIFASTASDTFAARPDRPPMLHSTIRRPYAFSTCANHPRGGRTPATTSFADGRPQRPAASHHLWGDDEDHRLGGARNPPATPFSSLLARRGRSRPRRAHDRNPSRRPEPQRGEGRRDGRDQADVTGR